MATETSIPLLAYSVASSQDSVTMNPNAWSLSVGKDVNLTLGADSLLITDPKEVTQTRYCGLSTSKSTASQEIPFYNILSAEVLETIISVKYAKLILKDDYTPSTLQYAIHGENKTKAGAWVDRLLELAYGDAQRSKRLRILINPFGGKGYAQNLYSEYAAPIFEAAGCSVDLESTAYSGHATEIAENLDVNAYDVIVCCSGDGLPYEVLNGLAKKNNATEALSKIAVTMLPCGSGNAMAWNLFGTNSISSVALSIVKGLRTPLDLASVTQRGSRTLSFLSQSYGIVAETDLGTDHLRWMGAARFTYGFLVRLLRKTTYPCDLAFKTEISDKQDIKEHYLAFKNKKPQLRPVNGADLNDQPTSLPPLKYGTIEDEIPSDWEALSSDTIGNFYAGNMAIMTADANFFPASLPNDGMIDVVTIDGTISRMRALSMMTAVENGEFFDYPEVVIRKVSGYRLTPRDRKTGYISVDGESIPFEPFQVEIHQGLGTVLSKTGHVYEAQGPL